MADLPAGQHMWVAYPGEVRRVRIVEKGAGGVVFKRGTRMKNPYVVFDDVDDEDFVMPCADLHHSPREASIEAAKLANEHGMVQKPSEEAPEENSEEDYEDNPVEDEEQESEDDEEEEEESEEGQEA